ncbi:MAG: GNAT family N-acetyltransferase [Lachnospiraceae bacterium]|nr:GNAT family N-acetyltransferase [Lachnospiraceae bacterium]
MKLRELKIEDAPLMLEWMHDESVVQSLKTDFSKKTIEDCIAFISAAADQNENLHLAIADETDTYMGTVSLKHITDDSAEFGISIRSCAMGKGFASFAMKEILQEGLERYHLQEIYWCVDPENKRAVRFYDKNGYERTKPIDKAQGYTEEEKERFLWYRVKHHG